MNTLPKPPFPLTPQGAPVAQLRASVPPGNATRKFFAALKQGGSVVACSIGGGIDDRLLDAVLYAMKPPGKLDDGIYEFWLTIDRDGLESWYPGVGDLYLHELWELRDGKRYKDFTRSAAWHERRSSHPESLITVHYHRYDSLYDDVSLWTWNPDFQTPDQNEIFPVGCDDFGVIFQIDRADFGNDDFVRKIGFVPRLAADWNRKDGGDRFWATDLGNEIYIVSTSDLVWSALPPLQPYFVSAFLDTPNRISVEVSHPLRTSQVNAKRITVTDETNRQINVFATCLVITSDVEASTRFEVITSEPLDVTSHSYEVRLQDVAGNITAVPRGLLNDFDFFCDADVRLGMTYTPEATTFRVFAPTASNVDVILYDSPAGGNEHVRYPLRRASKGIWEKAVTGCLEGLYYLFQVRGWGLSRDDGALDIYSINAVNSSTRARVTDLAKTNPPGWTHVKCGPPCESPVDVVIYEVNIRDFTISPLSGVSYKGKYLGLTEPGTRLSHDPSVKTGLDHLVELGITHVQLMPVQDFENDESGDTYDWGYLTTAFNSPEGWYATNIYDDSRIRELKQLVKALHERGIGVIMDVVYNHTSNSASFNAIVSQYYYRFLPDGNYSNGSMCGNDFRSESPMGRKFIVDSLVYWVQEYGIDGFRFDLMALIDFETMHKITTELRRIRPNIIIYGEPWAAGYSPIKGRPTDKNACATLRIGAFNDYFRNALKGWIDGPYTGFIQDGSHRGEVVSGLRGKSNDWVNEPLNTINYMGSHDDLVLYDKLKLSKPEADSRQIKDMMKIGYLLLLTAQGVPFIQAGEEFARTKRGQKNTNDAPDEINQIEWSQKKENYDLFIYVRDLIALRKAHPIFRLRTLEEIESRLVFLETSSQYALMYMLNGAGLIGETWKQACVLVNASDSEDTKFILPPGQWRVAFGSDGAVSRSFMASDTTSVRYKSGMIFYQE